MASNPITSWQIDGETVRDFILDHKEGWALKNWCFWTVVLEKTLESLLDCKEIQPVHSEGNQPWDFFGRNDAKAETPVIWPPHAKSWLIGKDPDAGLRAFTGDWRMFPSLLPSILLTRAYSRASYMCHGACWVRGDFASVSLWEKFSPADLHMPGLFSDSRSHLRLHLLRNLSCHCIRSHVHPQQSSLSPHPADLLYILHHWVWPFIDSFP